MELMPGHIPAPQVQERRKASLLTSAIPGPDLGGVDWGQGVVAWPESSPSYRVVQNCTDEIAEYGDEAEFGPVAARPFVIQSVTHCPRGSIAEMSARAERRLRAVTSQALAYELWTGEATALDPWSLPAGQVYGGLANPRPAASTGDDGPYLNPYLDGATMLGTSIADATAAMGAVEAAVAERMAGGPVYLHVPTDFVMGMGADLREVGDLLQTPTGSIVVADAGYPGPGAAGGSSLVIYGSGPVTVWLGEPTVFDQDIQVVDFEQNRVAVWAERPALMWFDPQTLVGCTVA